MLYRPFHFRRHRLQRGAFTLVELLVVIAIIGVLVGLLLPAVQAAREAARRCMCSNNIAQLGLAVHTYEFNNERMPSGVINPKGPIRNEPIGQHVGWIVQILPHMEQNNLYRHFDQASGVYASENMDARKSRISTLLCPSSPGIEGRTEEPKVAYTNYAGCHNDSEAAIDEDNNGVLFLNSRLRFSQIRDGSSQTILIGEMTPTINGLGWASGTASSLRNTSILSDPPSLLQIRQMGSEPTGSLEVGGFSSYHSGGCNFAFCDGSVRYLSKSIETKLFQQLGNRADGELLAGYVDW